MDKFNFFLLLFGDICYFFKYFSVEFLDFLLDVLSAELRWLLIIFFNFLFVFEFSNDFSSSSGMYKGLSFGPCCSNLF